MDRKKGLLPIIIIIILSSLLPPVLGDTAFSDGFEAQNFDLWDGNGVTSWQIGTYGSGTGGSADPHSGDYDAWSDATNNGDLISDDIDLSSATSANLSFWYQNDDIEPSDFYLYYWDGTQYIQIQSMDTGDDSWTQFNESIGAGYLISNFRIRLYSACGSNENIWVDDVLIEYTAAGINYVADLSQSLSSTPTVLTQGDYIINPPQSIVTSWAILTQWDTYTDLTQSLTSSWSVLIQTSFNVLTSLSNSFTWIVEAIIGEYVPINYVVDLAQSLISSWSIITQVDYTNIFTQSITSTWAIILQWNTLADLSQSITSTWQILTEWNAQTILTQSLTTSWSVLTQTSFNVITTLSNTFTWTVEAIKTTYEGIAHIVDLTQSIVTSWSVLIQTTFNVITTLSNTYTWTIDAIQGIQQTVALSLQITTSWIVDSSQTIYASAGGGGFSLLLVIVSLCTTLAIMVARKK